VLELLGTMTDRIVNNARFLDVDDVGKISDPKLCRRVVH
jgi:hypothetical protein